eukprot:CAMPEP_0171829660 /NCGR_PEP_ID=MMETSP0992-20121227/7816_1 /TAXON_ID=483369 /ORGANISM="non described non described, Strain CCMP2098" /LENGTH=257 /DNA_ID=CAMNT_0012444927 /DNA_START=169 /DNA_END=942 /DNA_ORIENTATION=+
MPSEMKTSMVQTVLVFDWDDTCCPTAFLRQLHLLSKNGDDVPTEFRLQIKQLEEAVKGCLCEAAKHGEVVIITNAGTGWVEKSARRFMPGLIPLLKNLVVVSARDEYTLASNTGNSIDWKVAAFTSTARELFGLPSSNYDLPLNPSLQILSFGDSFAERIAVKRAATSLGTISKSIKFTNSPSLGLLGSQVRVLTTLLPWLVASELDLDIELKKPDYSFLAPLMWGIASRACRASIEPWCFQKRAVPLEVPIDAQRS